MVPSLSDEILVGHTVHWTFVNAAKLLQSNWSIASAAVQPAKHCKAQPRLRMSTHPRQPVAVQKTVHHACRQLFRPWLAKSARVAARAASAFALDPNTCSIAQGRHAKRAHAAPSRSRLAGGCKHEHAGPTTPVASPLHLVFHSSRELASKHGLRHHCCSMTIPPQTLCTSQGPSWPRIARRPSACCGWCL